MPNHIQNRLTVTGENSHLLFEAIGGKYDDGKSVQIDFNKLIPYPKIYKDLDDAAFAHEKLYGYKGIPKDGFNSGGYEWCCENWGTKWNAYQQNDKRNTENVIYFQTAWSAPIGLIRILSLKFPLLNIVLEYADEDTGSNTGIITYFGGEIISAIQPESQSMEAYAIYFDLNPDDKDMYRLVDGVYEYIDE